MQTSEDGPRQAQDPTPKGPGGGRELEGRVLCPRWDDLAGHEEEEERPRVVCQSGGERSAEEDLDTERFASDEGPGWADGAGEEQVPGRRAWR